MKGKGKIAAALALTLLAGMYPGQVSAADRDLQVTLGFFDGDLVDITEVTSSSDDQISEGHTSVYNEAGELVEEWDLNGKSRTIEVDAGMEYRIETEFDDGSVYIDNTAYVSRPDVEGVSKDYWFPVDVRSRHLLPVVTDAQDGTRLYGCTFTLYDSSGMKAGELTTDWTEDDISMLPALAAGTYTVEAEKLPEGYYFEGAQTVELPYEDSEENNRREVLFNVGRISGAMNLAAVDGTGGPIEGVTFQVRSKETDETLSPVTTDSEGKVSVMDLPVGEYKDGKVTSWYTYEVVPVSVTDDFRDNVLETKEVSFEETKTQEGAFLVEDVTFTYQASDNGSGGGAGGSQDGADSGQNGEAGQEGSENANGAENSGNNQGDAARTGDTTNILLVVAVMEAALLVILKKKGEMA